MTKQVLSRRLTLSDRVAAMIDPPTFAVQAFEKRDELLCKGALVSAGSAREAIRHAADVADLLGGAVALSLDGDVKLVLARFGDVPEGYRA